MNSVESRNALITPEFHIDNALSLQNSAEVHITANFPIKHIKFSNKHKKVMLIIHERPKV